jgi:hypothetical protein
LPPGLLREGARHHLRQGLSARYQEETYSAFVHEIDELFGTENRIDPIVPPERDHRFVGAQDDWGGIAGAGGGNKVLRGALMGQQVIY